MKKKKSLLIYPIIAIAFVIAILIPTKTPEAQGEPEDLETLKADVIAVVNEIVEGDTYIQTLELKFINGSMEGETIRVDNDESSKVSHRVFEEGDRVIVTHLKGQEIFYIADYVRTNTLLILFVIFILLAVSISGRQGLGAILGLGFSFIIIFKLILPQILAGSDPVIAAVIGSILIIPLTFYSSHGANRKTTIAVLGTLITLVLAGVLAVIFANLGDLTGLASEESTFLKMGTAEKINFKGLVLAGMLISILGVLDDITIAQASVVEQIKSAKEKISNSELYKRSMRVGRDHIASMVNTLILVYTGASLPLLLLFLDRSQAFSDLINYEFIAEEIIRTLIGSISLIMAVPITTILATILIKKEYEKI